MARKVVRQGALLPISRSPKCRRVHDHWIYRTPKAEPSPLSQPEFDRLMASKKRDKAQARAE